MARGWRYIKPFLSSFLILYCFWHVLCVIVFLFSCSRWSFLGVPLIFACPVDHVPDGQPRILLGMVEARSVNMKTHAHIINNSTYEFEAYNRVKFSPISVNPSDQLNCCEINDGFIPCDETIERTFKSTRTNGI